MTVGELIEELKRFPLDVEVVVDNGECEGFQDNENVYNIDGVEGQIEYRYGEVQRVLLK